MTRDPWADVVHVPPPPTPPVDLDVVLREQRRLEALREFLLGPRTETRLPLARYL
jgi:hypothetical protein